MSTIGNTASVLFTDFGADVQAKVDTGATTSSLHAENIKIVSRRDGREVVQFSCPPLSDNICYLPMIGKNEIKSASGTQIRPVVILNVEIEGKQLGECEFNLTDRSDMEAAVLLGQNVLQAGDFSIEVNKDSSKPDAPDDSTNEATNNELDSEDKKITDPDVTVDDFKKFLSDVEDDAFVTITNGDNTITMRYENLRNLIKQDNNSE